MNHRKLLDAAVELAYIDEGFRRDLADKLKALGEGKRGGVSELGEKEHILAAYRAARCILEQSGARVTTVAAARMLAQGPFPKYRDDPTSLERLIRKYLSK